MRIAEIDIKDLFGCRQQRFAPGTLTIIEGANGKGKSSLIGAVLRVFEGGHDPSILRRGAKLGECTITLDSGATIRMRVSARGTTYEVTDREGNEVKAPRSYIEKLGEALTVDPSRLLLAKPKDLASVLLETMPIKFQQAELQAALDENVWIQNQDLDLQGFEDLEKQIYDKRAEANKAALKAKNAVQQLRSSLPEAEDCDWHARAKELRQTLADTKAEREAKIAEIDRDERNAVDAAKAEAERKIEAIRAELERTITAARGLGRNERARIDAEHEPVLARLSAAIGEAEQKTREHDRADGVRQQIVANERDYRIMSDSSEKFSAALERLKELKAGKLASLPIPGIEVRDGQVYVEGISFERVNLAERIKLAFQICSLRAGQLPFLVLDQAEAFDSETWDAFKAGAAESGFQVLAARVSDGDLAISTAA